MADVQGSRQTLLATLTLPHQLPRLLLRMALDEFVDYDAANFDISLKTYDAIYFSVLSIIRMFIQSHTQFRTLNGRFTHRPYSRTWLNRSYVISVDQELSLSYWCNLSGLEKRYAS